jgi:lactoylglutathione lyase
MGGEEMADLGFTGLGHVAIRARDIDRVLDFYTTMLGFTEMFRLNQDDGSLMLVYVRVTDTQYLEFFPNGQGDGPAPRTAVGLNHICLAVSDLDQTVAELTARGVAIAQAIKYGRDGNRQAWIADPEGNRLELMEMAVDSKQAEAIARLNAGATA